MAGYSKFIWGAGLAVGLALAAQFSALADEKKKAEGDNFSEKLKDRFPSEAKRGEKSIFRSVKDSDTGDSKKEETKREPRIVAKPSKTKTDESKKEEKPKVMLADLFKSKSKTEDKDKKTDDKKKSRITVAKEESDKDETPKVMLADLFKSKPKDDADEGEADEKKKPRITVTKEQPEKTETPKVMFADLFKGRSEKEDNEKEAPKEDAPDKKKADEKKSEPRVVKEASKEEEKPKFMLADLFKSKSNKVDEKEQEKALKDATANGESEEVKDKKEAIKPMLVAKPSDSEAKLDEIKDEEKSARRVSAPKFFGKKTAKVEAPVVAETTPAKPEEIDKKKGADTDEPKAKDKKKEKSKGWASNSKLFGKKSTKAETLVIPEDSLTNKPAPKVEFSKVDTSKDLGEGGDFKSWDDLPYKRKSSVDRMMGKLNIKPISPRPAAGLPGPRLPGGPSKPAPKSE